MDNVSVDQAMDLVGIVVLLSVAALIGALFSVVALRLVFRLSRADRLGAEARARCRWPSRCAAALIGMLAVTPVLELDPGTRDRLVHVLVVLIVIAGTATALRFTGAVEAVVLDRFDLETADNARARGRYTKVVIARRLVTAALVVLGTAAVLLTFEGARTVGTSLLASAGVVGIVAGIAGQSTLGNVVAGLQISITEPLSIDDVVVVEGQWGNIEELTLTYVVVRTWDRRRLVLPTSYFVSTPFENWTRNGSQVIGDIVWQLDHRTPISALREEYHRQVEAQPLWDGDVVVLQVIDTTATTIAVRGLVTARTAQAAWDLRCAIREGLTTWLADVHPEALPSTRLLEAASAPAGAPRPEPTTDWQSSPGPDTEPNPDPERAGRWPTGTPT